MFTSELKEKYPFLVEYFEKTIKNSSHNLSHSIVFYGNDLNMQYKFAKEIARILNCQKSGEENCDCLSCSWARENEHPAIVTVSKTDNSKKGLALKEIREILSTLLISSDYYRVFIFCDKNEYSEILGLNKTNFSDDCANTMLKTLEEPPSNTVFFFLTRDKSDLLETVLSRSQCFFIPSFERENYEFPLIEDVFINYPNLERIKSFDLAQMLNNLVGKENSVIEILTEMQNYIHYLLKSDFMNYQQKFIKDIKHIENAKKQAEIGVLPLNVFENLILNITQS